MVDREQMVDVKQSVTREHEQNLLLINAFKCKLKRSFQLAGSN